MYVGHALPIREQSCILKTGLRTGEIPRIGCLGVQRPILNFAPRGQRLTLGSKLSPRGEFCPLGVK
jgi:hypothetical protein